MQRCGGETVCEIEGGSYYLIPPEGRDAAEPAPAVVFFHGYRSSGKTVLKSGLRKVFGAAGYAIIAPNGAKRPGTEIRAWPARLDVEDWRDDIAFTKAVIEDVAKRTPLDRSRILISGFSAGASMAWMIACYEGGRYAGYAAVAGALRRPVPTERCPAGPARLLQVHGFADVIVPLEGRGIRDWHQGDVFESLALLRRTDGCRTKPDAIDLGAKFWRREWTSCESGRDIVFLMHAGGHRLPPGWVDAAFDWFKVPPEAP